MEQDTAALIARLHFIAAESAALDAEAKAIKATLRRALGTGDHMLNGQKALSIRPQRRFSAEQAQKVLTPELLALCTVTVIDSKRARDNLPRTVYEACQVESGEPVVRLV